MAHGARGETAPLLRARRRDAHDHAVVEPCDEPLGSARFPWHPTARATPRWRKLVLHFFDDQTHSSATLGTCDLWRLEPQFRGAQAAADLKKKIPSAGRARLLRGVCAVNRGRLVRVALLNLAATPLAALRPLLLLYLNRTGLPTTEAATADPRVVGGTWEVYVPVSGIVITQLLLGLVRAHAASLAVLLYLQLSCSLSTLITERVVTSGAQVDGFTSPEAKEAPVGRKQRLTEITYMLSNDLSRVASMPLFTHSAWSVIVQLVVSVAVLVNVVEISWVVVCAVAVAYVVLLLAEVTVGTSFASRFEIAFARRLNAIHESIMSIRMVKMNAWEDKMEHKILEARARETSAANRVSALTFVMKEITKESPTLVTALVFAMGSSSSSTVAKATGMSPLQVFTTLVLVHDCFRCAEKAKSAFQTVVIASRAWKKFESFLLVSEKNLSQSTSSSNDSSKLAEGVIAEMRGACMSAATQATDALPLLVNVDWVVRRGELVVIHGPAGVGKSILLGALLGEGSTSKVLSGSFCSPSLDCRIAYCSQDSWLQTLPIRDNILFGAAFDEEKYWVVVNACGLLEDLVALPAGDATPVGPRGINLSSGQSARIALARACYADADLYLLDCPLANVDAVVQSEIFRKCIVELLMFKTVVIVTHNPEYIGSSFVDQLVEVSSHGVRVKSRAGVRGSKTRIISQGVAQTRRMRDYQSTMSRKPNDRSLWITPMSNESEATAEQIRDSRIFVTASQGDGAEQRDTFISKAAIMQFISGGGPRGWVCIVATGLFSVLWGATCICRDVWILSWQSISPAVLPSEDSVEFVPVIYSALAFACVVLGLLTQASALAFNVESTGQLFSRMVRAILRATMTFFYTTPLGDILNPFVSDLGEVDMILPQHVSALVSSSVTLLGRAIVFGWVLGPFAVAITVAANAVLLRALSVKFYVGLTHLVRVSNGRQLSVMAEVLDGETVLRAFGEEHIAHKVRELEAAFEIKSRIEYFTDTFNSFAILREEALLAAQSLGLLAVLFMRSVTPAQFLLALFYIIMTQQEFIFRFGSGLINTCDQLYSIERLRHFGESEVETDISSEMPSCIVDSEWPKQGEVVFDHVNFTYSNHHQDLNKSTLALRGVSFTLRGGEKIGVVGRTGSGKSSLAMALLRVHPLRSGCISLDGVDLRTVSLKQLRRSVTMIPQSPTFYRCSVRDYLDPFQEFEDARLWQELLTVELGARVQSLEEELLDNGENWSLGQRQLLCFARALLKPSRVVVLDEAFSCVDQSCQEKILRVLRDRFVSSTVVLITHRLEQILEFDRILVMRGGRVVESGSASELASDAGSVFYEFLETSLLTF